MLVAEELRSIYGGSMISHKGTEWIVPISTGTVYMPESPYIPTDGRDFIW